MRFAFVADVHLANHRWCGGDRSAGVNARCRAQLEVLGKALSVAQEAGATEFVVVGDLFDAEDPDPQLVTATMERLDRELPRRVIVKGNHDSVSSSGGDHALGPLAWVGDVRDQSSIVGGNGGLGVIPFQAGPAHEWFPEAWARATQGCKASVVAMHLGIADSATPSFLRDAPDAVQVGQVAKLAKRSGAQFVVAGNWHQHRVWTFDHVTIIQCGALAPIDFSDAEPMDKANYGSVILIDPLRSQWKRVEIPGPRFEVISWDDTAAAWVGKLAKYARKHGHTLYVQARAEPSRIAEARGALEQVQGLAGYRVLPDVQAVREIARKAAEATRGATTLTDAVREYVGKLSLDVDQGELLGELFRYLGGVHG